MQQHYTVRRWFFGGLLMMTLSTQAIFANRAAHAEAGPPRRPALPAMPTPTALPRETVDEPAPSPRAPARRIQLTPIPVGAASLSTNPATPLTMKRALK